MKTIQLNFTSLAVLMASAASVACGESVDSEFIRTGGMYADITAVTSGNGTTVTARLLVGGANGTTVTLSTGDRLRATVDDETKTLGSVGSDRYRSNFDADEGGTPVVVSFLRGEVDAEDADGNLDAPDSNGELPEPFSLSLSDVDRGGDIERGEPVAFEWDPPGGGGEIAWQIAGDCIWTESGDAADDGSFEIAARDVRVRSADEGEECDVTLTVERNVRGEVDPAFREGGRFVLTQRRTVSFNSTPAPGEGME